MEAIRSVRLERCPTCQSTDISWQVGPPPSEPQWRDFALFVCADCTTGFVNPRPIEEDIPKLYVSRAYGMDLGTRNRWSYWLKSTKLRFYVSKLFRHAPDRDLSVLDYGCGDGMLSDAIARHGARKGRVTRVVASDFACEAPAGLRSASASDALAAEYVQHGQLFSEEFECAFDVIVLRHVLEHTPDPPATIARLASLSKPDGVVVIEIPNFDSPWRRWFGSHYCQLGIPQHLVHFNANSLRRALSALERAGQVTLLELRGVNIPVLGSSLGYVATKRFDNIGPAAALLYPLQLAVDVLAGQRTALMAHLRVTSPHGRPPHGTMPTHLSVNAADL